MNSLIQCGHLYSQQNAPTGYLYQEYTESPQKKIRLEAIASKKDEIVNCQNKIAVVNNKLAAERDNVLASEKDGGDPIVTGSFNKFSYYVF